MSPQPGQLGTILTIKGPSKAGCTELAYATFLSNPSSNKDVLKQARNTQKYLHIHALAYASQHNSARMKFGRPHIHFWTVHNALLQISHSSRAEERIKLMIIMCITHTHICHVSASTYITHVHSPRGFSIGVALEKGQAHREMVGQIRSPSRCIFDDCTR